MLGGPAESVFLLWKPDGLLQICGSCVSGDMSADGRGPSMFGDGITRARGTHAASVNLFCSRSLASTVTHTRTNSCYEMLRVGAIVLSELLQR